MACFLWSIPHTESGIDHFLDERYDFITYQKQSSWRDDGLLLTKSASDPLLRERDFFVFRGVEKAKMRVSQQQPKQPNERATNTLLREHVRGNYPPNQTRESEKCADD